MNTENTLQCPTDRLRFSGDISFYPNNENVVALQNSCGCESLTDKNTAITQLSTLTTVPHVAETRMNSAFAGGGLSNSKPHKAFTAHEVCSYTQTFAKEVQSTPIMSSRNVLRAEGGPVRSYTQTSAKEVQSMLVMSSRNRLRARQTKNFRLAGSQTKIRHKLKDLCDSV